MLTLLPAPIGNLLDISLRSLQALAQAQVVLCEDTRVARKLYTLLLDRSLFGALLDSASLSQKRFIALHSHNEQELIATFDSEFFAQDIVYLSDAGMPTISDPGAKLVQWCITHNIPYDVLPGSSALNVCFASSGIESQSFFFGGFLPHNSWLAMSVDFGLLADLGNWQILGEIEPQWASQKIGQKTAYKLEANYVIDTNWAVGGALLFEDTPGKDTEEFIAGLRWYF